MQSAYFMCARFVKTSRNARLVRIVKSGACCYDAGPDFIGGACCYGAGLFLWYTLRRRGSSLSARKILKRAHTQHARRKGEQQREAVASLVLDNTHTPPTGKWDAAPRHRTPGRDAGRARRGRRTSPPERTTKHTKFYSCPPRRGGAEGRQQTPGQTRSRRKTKNATGRKRGAAATKNTQAQHPGRAAAPKDY